MTREQFNLWKKTYFAAFPDALAWLNRLEDPKATLEAWYKCLARCDFHDLEEATERVICGDLRMPGLMGSTGFETMQREQTAIHMRSYANRISDDRKRLRKQFATRQQVEQGREAARRDSGPSMAGMFKKICEIRADGEAQGLSGGELKEWAAEQLGEWLNAGESGVSDVHN